MLIGWWTDTTSGRPVASSRPSRGEPRVWLSWTMSKSSARSRSRRSTRRLKVRGSGKPAVHMVSDLLDVDEVAELGGTRRPERVGLAVEVEAGHLGQPDAGVELGVGLSGEDLDLVAEPRPAHGSGGGGTRPGLRSAACCGMTAVRHARAPPSGPDRPARDATHRYADPNRSAGRRRVAGPAYVTVVRVTPGLDGARALARAAPRDARARALRVVASSLSVPSLEWPGKTWADGSMTTAALLTAVAASPKPTAIRRTLPGYSVMSPAAKTRARLVRIAAFDHDVALLDLDPPVLAAARGRRRSRARRRRPGPDGVPAPRRRR